MPYDEYRYWSSDKRFGQLLTQLISLDLGSWSMSEVEAALSTLEWKLRPVDPPEARDRALWHKQIVDWELGPGPRAGLATVMVSRTDAHQAVKLTVNLSHGIDFDTDYNDGPDYAQIAFIQSAWSMVETTLGVGATFWSGPRARVGVRSAPGVRMVWERPGTSWSLRLDCDQVLLELKRTGIDDAECQEPSPVWRAVEPADLPITALPDSVTDWDDLRGRLDTVLCALCADVPTLPGRFMLRLRSLSDPIFEVSAWNHHNTLGIEIPATISNTPSDHYTARGWMLQGNVWRQWFDKARFRHQNVAAATERLVETLSASQMAPTGLVYHGYIDACDRMLRLDLPELGITRDDRDGREIA